MNQTDDALLAGATPAEREAVKQLSAFWWVWLVIGAIWIVAALVILQFSESSFKLIGVLIGAMFIAAGVQYMAISTLMPKWRWVYLLFAALVGGLPGAGFRGVSVTIPHKEAAFELADRLSPHANAIGAVNTLVFEPGGECFGDNTDAPGFIASLPSPPTERSTALVLGAGGVARAVVWALRDRGVDGLIETVRGVGYRCAPESLA